jgi:uncharacterized peroxidase-related enzyme
LDTYPYPGKVSHFEFKGASFMAHISLPAHLPGITGPLSAYPDTAQHLLGLAEALLRGPSSLTPGERELIATYVSSQNLCHFCTQSHAAATRYLLGPERGIVDQVLAEGPNASVSAKMRELLVIAGKVQQGGRRVTEEDVARARAEGADDKAIHDTVLIAAAFCMYNRYVDGLATWAPEEPAAYERMGEGLGRNGYTSKD